MAAFMGAQDIQRQMRASVPNDDEATRCECDMEALVPPPDRVSLTILEAMKQHRAESGKKFRRKSKQLRNLHLSKIQSQLSDASFEFSDDDQDNARLKAAKTKIAMEEGNDDEDPDDPLVELARPPWKEFISDEHFIDLLENGNSVAQWMKDEVDRMFIPAPSIFAGEERNDGSEELGPLVVKMAPKYKMIPKLTLPVNGKKNFSNVSILIPIALNY